jgi:photosystem II stability/assembly factor-like uncharacterized protein
MEVELALDEVELVWKADSPQTARPSAAVATGVAGARILSQQGFRAVVSLHGVRNVTELVRTAESLRAANLDADVHLVVYAPGPHRSPATRRLLNREVRLRMEPGAIPQRALVGLPAAAPRAIGEMPGEYLVEAREPMATLDLAVALGRRPGVRSAYPVAIADRLAKTLDGERLQRATPPAPFDEPAEAQEFFALKRRLPGDAAVPVELYRPALEHMRQMPRYSTRQGILLPPQSAMDPADIAAASLGAWTELGPGNIGGRTRVMLIHPTVPTTMYAAGVAGGVWKTTNGGASWAPLADLMANLAVSSMAMDPVNPDVIYAGTGEGYFNIDMVRGAGIFKTTDAGMTWAQLANTNNSDFYYVNKIVVSPNNALQVYAATRSGLWRSTDGGTTWIQMLNAAGGNGCLDLAIRTDVVTDTLFASCGTFTQALILRNPDAGGAGVWERVLSEPHMGRTSLAIAPSNQATIYALSASIDSTSPYNHGLHALFRSTSGGIAGSWTAQVRNTDPTRLNTVLLTNPLFAFASECGFGVNQFFNQGWYDNVIAVDPGDPNRIWAGGIDLLRSDDGGMNWGLASYWWSSPVNPHYAHADQHAIVFHPQYDGTTNATMFVGNDGGLFRTDNARAATAMGPIAPCNENNTAVSWTTLNNSYSVTQFYNGLPYPGGTTYFGGTQDNGTLRGTDAGGTNAWSTILGGDGGYVAVDPVDTNILYAENYGLSIKKSTNGGTFWSSATSGIADSGVLFIVPFIMDSSDALRLWTGGYYLWRTTDGALNWTRASAITAGVGSVSAIAVAQTNANNVLAGLSDGYIHRTDIGLSSTSLTVWPVAQPRPGYVSSLNFDPVNASIAYATYSTFGGTHVWRSADAGATWTGIDGSGLTGIPDIPVHSIVVDPANTSRLYVGTDLGVFVSRDGGGTWAVENTGFANVITESLSVGNVVGTPHIFAFTHGRGAWRVPTADASPVPALTSLAPMSATAGGAAFTLTATGTDFVAASVVRWNGADRATTFVSGTQLQAVIPASDIAVAGTAQVTVFNPAPGGGISNPLTFTIDPPPPLSVAVGFGSVPVIEPPN